MKKKKKKRKNTNNQIYNGNQRFNYGREILLSIKSYFIMGERYCFLVSHISNLFSIYHIDFLFLCLIIQNQISFLCASNISNFFFIYHIDFLFLCLIIQNQISFLLDFNNRQGNHERILSTGCWKKDKMRKIRERKGLKV